MDSFFQKLAEYLPAIIALFATSFALSQARRITNDIIHNISEYKILDANAIELLAHKLVFNFYLAFIAIIIILAATLKLIGTELFIAFLTADLVGLGLKLTLEGLNNSKTK